MAADGAPLLAVSGLNAWYGRAQVLHGVGFEMGTESVAVIGRNGMGKTSLCLALMGLMPKAEGSVPLRRQGADGPPPVPDRRRPASASCRRAAACSSR